MNASMNDQYVDKFLEASMNGDLELLKKMMKGIANINIKNDRGWTALMLAARNGHTRVVKELLENSADVTTINSSGQNVLDIAKFWNHTDIIELLKGDKDERNVSLYNKDVHKGLVNFFGTTVLGRAADKRKNGEWLNNVKTLKSTNYILLSELNPVSILETATSIVDPKTPKYRLCTAGYKDIKEYIDANSPLVIFLGLQTVKLTEPRQTFSESTDVDDSLIAWFSIDVTDMADTDIRKIHPDAEVLGFFPGAMSLIPNHGALFAQARSVMAWHDRYQFCPTCGSKTTVGDAGYKRTCTTTDCRSLKGVHNTSYPRVDPTTIMAVISPDGKKLLLSRGRKWPKGMYSCLAGFIEPGETIEAACRREVLEESGIEIGRVEYHSCQPWPMPSSLMIGCLAYATSEEIRVDKEELENVQWFSRQDVVLILTHKHPDRLFCPPEQAIAHQLIRAWVNMTSNL